MYKKKINENTTVRCYGYEFEDTKGVAMSINGYRNFSGVPIVYLEDVRGKLVLGINYELCREIYGIECIDDPGVEDECIEDAEDEENTLPCPHSGENGECELSPDTWCTGSQEEQDECAYR